MTHHSKLLTHDFTSGDNEYRILVLEV